MHEPTTRPRATATLTRAPRLAAAPLAIALIVGLLAPAPFAAAEAGAGSPAASAAAALEPPAPGQAPGRLIVTAPDEDGLAPATAAPAHAALGAVPDVVEEALADLDAAEAGLRAASAPPEVAFEERATAGRAWASVTVGDGSETSPAAAAAVDAAASALAAEGLVVERDSVLTADRRPDDPRYDTTRGQLFGAEAVWARGTGEGTTVAILDTGVDETADLPAERILEGYDAITEATGPVPDGDPGLHGTYSAEVAAGTGDNGVAGAGGCWDCDVLPVRVFPEGGGPADGSRVADGIDHAVEAGADVINLSLGGPWIDTLLLDAIEAAAEAGVIIVASAGNEGVDAERWPAAHPDVVGVAGLESAETLFVESNYGDWVDVGAPWCSPVGDDAGIYCGTSAAAPVVAGLTASLISASGVAGPPVIDAVRDGAAPIGEPIGGRLDVAAALDLLDDTALEDDDDEEHGEGEEGDPGEGPGSSFGDVPEHSAHAEAIDRLASRGIITGFDDGTFRPFQHVSRAETASLLDRAFDVEAGEAPTAFDDVPSSSGHAEAIDRLASAEVIGGFADGSFRPFEPVTRAEAASLLDRVLGRALDLPEVTGNAFDDVPESSAHAEAINRMAATGVITGFSDGAFQPFEPVSRAEIASLLDRGLGLVP